MISSINGFSANMNYDLSSAHERNLKAHEEKEAINLTSNQASNMEVAQPNSTNQANPKNSENVSNSNRIDVDFNIKEMEAAIREIKSSRPAHQLIYEAYFL